MTLIYEEYIAKHKHFEQLLVYTGARHALLYNDHVKK